MNDDSSFAALKRKEAEVLYMISREEACNTSYIADRLDWASDTGSVSYRTKQLKERGMVETRSRPRTNGFNETQHFTTQRGEKALREALSEYNIVDPTDMMERIQDLETEIERLNAKIQGLSE